MPASSLESAIEAARSVPSAELVVDKQVRELRGRPPGSGLLDPREGRRGALGEAVEERLSKRLLGGKKLVERADRRARAACDLGHRRGLVTLPGEEFGSRVEERGDALLSALPLRLLGNLLDCD